MSTTNTALSWYWYTRQKGRNFYFGLVDGSGLAPTNSGLNIDIWYIKIPVDIEDVNDTISIPEEYVQEFIKDVVAEYLLIDNPGDPRISLFKKEADEGKRDLRRLIGMETASTKTIQPIDIRMD